MESLFCAKLYVQGTISAEGGAVLIIYSYIYPLSLYSSASGVSRPYSVSAKIKLHLL